MVQSEQKPGRLKELLKATIMFGIENNYKLNEYEQENYRVSDQSSDEYYDSEEEKSFEIGDQTPN